MDLFGVDLTTFDGSGDFNNGWGGDSIDLMTSVRSVGSDEEVRCAKRNDCWLRYKREYTPHIYDIVPNQVYKGKRVDWWVNTMAINNVLTPGRLPVEELSMDGVLNNWEELLEGETIEGDFRLNWY